MSLESPENSVHVLAAAALTANREMSAISLRHASTIGKWPAADDEKYRALGEQLAFHLDDLANTEAPTLTACRAKARVLKECCDPATLHPELALSLAADLVALLG